MHVLASRLRHIDAVIHAKGGIEMTVSVLFIDIILIYFINNISIYIIDILYSNFLKQNIFCGGYYLKTILIKIKRNNSCSISLWYFMFYFLKLVTSTWFFLAVPEWMKSQIKICEAHHGKLHTDAWRLPAVCVFCSSSSAMTQWKRISAMCVWGG